MRPRITLFTAAVLGALAVVGCDQEPAARSEGLLMGPELGPSASHTAVPGPPTLLLAGLEGASGSVVGPGGELYVTEGAAGRLSRVDPETGAVATVAEGLPPSLVGIGGAVDVAFLDDVAYVLVTLVDDPLFPTGAVNGIYRVDGPDEFTVIADIGAYNLAHPPTAGFDYFLETGVLYAMEPYRGGFLVTDGHLNRVLYVTLGGQITVFRAFGNIVPTGMEIWGHTIYMTEAGPLPHLPENGKVVSFGPKSSAVAEVASGARLAVDVERGRGNTLFALSQGVFGGGDPGAPASPNTGSLFQVDDSGGLTLVADGLNLPTSLEIIDNTAYVVGLAGEIWTIENIAGPPFGRTH